MLLQQTPYGKAFIAAGGALAGTNINYLVNRGYIVVISDVRGTGDSGGSFDLFDPVQSTDGVTLAKWAAALPHSDGKVGLFGESYMGINQFQTVERGRARTPPSRPSSRSSPATSSSPIRSARVASPTPSSRCSTWPCSAPSTWAIPPSSP